MLFRSDDLTCAKYLQSFTNIHLVSAIQKVKRQDRRFSGQVLGMCKSAALKMAKDPEDSKWRALCIATGKLT